MTTKIKVTKKNSKNIYLSGKTSSGVLRKISRKASETDEEERNDETFWKLQTCWDNETDNSEDEKKTKLKIKLQMR